MNEDLRSMDLWHLLLALAAVVLTGRLLGRLFRFIGQPPVIGEVVAGILLGPSFLGGISHEAYTFVLPASVAPFMHFMLFLGVAMSITAFPVLARILADQGLTRAPLGRLALSCAAINDGTAWCLLAFIVGVVNRSGGSALLPSVLTLAFIIFMFVVVRPVAVRLSNRWDGEEPDRQAVALALVAMLVTMAIVTTMATTPVLRLVMPEAILRRASISPQPSS
jgi:Kef-type K+ transport system membrane component KefB